MTGINGLNIGDKEARIQYYVSDIGQSFQKVGSHFLGSKITAECIDIENE